MYKQIKASIKPLIKDEELYKKVKAEIKSILAKLPVPAVRVKDQLAMINNYVGGLEKPQAGLMKQITAIKEILASEGIDDDNVANIHTMLAKAQNEIGDFQKQLSELSKILDKIAESTY